MSEADMKGRWEEAIGSGEAGQEARRMPKGSARFATKSKERLSARGNSSQAAPVAPTGVA
jgi:hypothetical protein